uniref:Uncharacterized protein n=1 Tax=Anguilla anguilla TaxID=7936 RepID=A0A0E9R5W0_ANGAN
MNIVLNVLLSCAILYTSNLSWDYH